MNEVKHKKRSEEEKKNLIRRLNIISGQINGISGMVEDDRYCADIILQISSVNNSLKSLGNELLKMHMESCLVDDIKNDNLDTIDEVIDLFSKLNR